MVRIVELDDRYRAWYFEDAEPIPRSMYNKAMKKFPDASLKGGYLYIDRWGNDGYIVAIGLKDGHFVPKYTDYSKEMYDLDTVIKLAKNIDKCGICKELNKDVGKIESIELLEDKKEVAPMKTIKEAETDGEKPKPASLVKDALSSIFLDMLLTREGKFFLGALLEDDELLEEALPKTEEEMYEFVANFADFLRGKRTLVKTPEELSVISETARKKAEAIRRAKGEVVETEEEEKKEEEKPKKVIVI